MRQLDKTYFKEGGQKKKREKRKKKGGKWKGGSSVPREEERGAAEGMNVKPCTAGSKRGRMENKQKRQRGRPGGRDHQGELN